MDSTSQDCVYPVEVASRAPAPRRHPPRSAGEQECERSTEAARPDRTEACISQSHVVIGKVIFPCVTSTYAFARLPMS